ncbi:hypothetical protein QCE62_06960 [Caballeronia sp. LZ033]|uniref:Acb2/Tad1 domain-containing protein n=1 Tax=Caballeronia sp. LZ033 TaxID=3038566 RepID=UPI00285BD700|nr:hypothetical protein [Caballeronia sp. LZ033]MDR5813331.1 hypothetical protein [Caballeronia sp. LZ033]
MGNQHRQISGYRELSPAEIDLINRIKAHAEETRALVVAVRETVDLHHAIPTPLDAEPGEFVSVALYGGHNDGPFRWVCLADDHLQQGFMALTRAVAQPTSY